MFLKMKVSKKTPVVSQKVSWWSGVLAFSLPLLGTVSLHLLRESGLMHVSLCAFPRERVLLSVGDLHKRQAKGSCRLLLKNTLVFNIYIIYFWVHESLVPVHWRQAFSILRKGRKSVQSVAQICTWQWQLFGALSHSSDPNELYTSPQHWKSQAVLLFVCRIYHL